ncbi:hypothetical protein NQD34_004288 [Periophthalmus magnuspinnatus]|nr:hypothetical protein NQD34_004288 [Periophthalmus magnuspinnatus]
MLTVAGKSVSLYTVKQVLYKDVHKDLNFCRHVLWSDETKLFGQARTTNCEIWGWQHHVVRVFCCRRDWCTSQNTWHHEERTLYGNTDATAQNISQEVKAWAQMGLLNRQ